MFARKLFTNMALTVRIQKHCKYVFIEFISFAFFALFVSRQALFIFLFVCFHCSENHVHIHIHIQRFTYTEIVSTRCGCRILNLCVFEANPIFTDFSQRLGATSHRTWGPRGHALFSPGKPFLGMEHPFLKR